VDTEVRKKGSRSASTLSLSFYRFPFTPTHRSRDKVTLSPNIHESGPLLAKHKNDEDEEEVDTDLETDRLLGHQMLDDGFYDDKNWSESKLQHRGLLPKISPKVKQSSMGKSNSSSLLRHGLNVLLPTSTSSDCCINNNNSPSMLTTGASFHQTRSLKTSPALNSSNLMSLIHGDDAAIETSPRKVDLLDEPKDEQSSPNNNQPDTIELCNLDSDLVDSPGGSSSDKSKKDEDLMTGEKKKKNKNKEGKELAQAAGRQTNSLTLSFSLSTLTNHTNSAAGLAFK
jgi:hypothetical protein